MKAVFALIAIGILLFGCAAGEPRPFVCNTPYIQVGTECCLDKDGSRVCDKDEQGKPPAKAPPASGQNQSAPLEENKTAVPISTANYTAPGKGWCSKSWKGGEPEYIPAGSCSGYYDENTLVRPWCNSENLSLEENCEICGCAEQLPCIDRKCERPQPEAPAGAMHESDTGKIGTMDAKVVKVYSDHTADIELTEYSEGITQSEIVKIGYGKNVARRVANSWYVNLSLESSGFVPTGTTYPARAKSWAVIKMENYTTECLPLYLADVLRITYVDGNEHRQKLDVSPSWSDVRGWSLKILDHRYYDSRVDKSIDVVLNNSAYGISGTGMRLLPCGSDSRQISVRLSSDGLYDYAK